MVSDLLQTLDTLADPACIDFARRTYPTELRVIGVTNPNLRLVLRELKVELKAQDGRAIIDLAHAMIATDVD